MTRTRTGTRREIRTEDLHATLLTLDPADAPDTTLGPRARADLDRILDSDPAPRPVARPAARPRRVPRVVLAGGLVAAATAMALVLPSLTGGDEAFATWTAAPSGLSAAAGQEAAADCRDRQADGPGAAYTDDLARSVTAVAERRGVWTTVLLAGRDGFAALCLTDSSTHLFGESMIGSVGTPTDAAAPGPRQVRATDLGVGTMSAGDVSLAAGVAGSDVVSVVYRSAERGLVEATVSEGHFALWLPGDELEDAPSRGVTVEVGYRDGSTGSSRLQL